MKGNIGLLHLLKNDGGVTAYLKASGKNAPIFLVEAPQEQKLPFVVIQKNGETPHDTKSGASTTQHDQVSAFCSATNLNDAYELASAVRYAADGKGGEFSGIKIENIRFLNEQDFEEKIDNKKMFTVEIEFEIRTKQTWH